MTEEQDRSDRDAIVRMLARTNMRYTVAVHAQGATVIAQGKRTSRMPIVAGVTFEFDSDGALLDVLAEA